MNHSLNGARPESLLQPDNFNLDVFELQKVSNGTPLRHVGLFVFEQFGINSEFNIDRTTLENYLSTIEGLYRPENPYHNNMHAADVTWSLNYLLLHSKLSDVLTKLELFAVIIAAVIHDCDHPGFNNPFLVSTAHPLALTHNDISVLENHHCSSGFLAASLENHNIFKNFDRKLWVEFRQLVIYLVLGTDFGKHNEIMKTIEVTANRGWNYEDKNDRNLVILLTLKCADLGHVSKSSHLHKNWTCRITKEFLRQGDQEKQLGLSISPGMDRETLQLSSSQTFFIGTIVLPMYKLFVANFPECKERLQQTEENLEFWKNGGGDSIDARIL